MDPRSASLELQELARCLVLERGWESDSADGATAAAHSLLRTSARKQDWSVADLWPGLGAMNEMWLPTRPPGRQGRDTL